MRISTPGITPSGEPLSFSWQGRSVDALPGDTVASALLAAGERACRTSAPDDRRGVFCGMGVCHECAILVEGGGERLACLTPVRPTLSARSSDRLLDLDVLPPAHDVPESILSPDLLVVGAGPAGLAIAAIVAEQGYDVVVIDDRGKLGGQYYKQPSSSFAVDEKRLDGQYRAGRALMRRTTDAGVRIIRGGRLWGAESARRVFVAGETERWDIRAHHVAIAAGAYERGVPFPGWTLPGVMTTGAAQTMSRSYQVSPGERVLVAGNGPLNLQVAAELSAAGAEVVGLVELARPLRFSALLRGPQMLFSAPDLLMSGARYGASLARGRVPIFTEHVIVEAHGDETGVTSATIAPWHRGGVDRSREKTFAVDAVCLGYGFIPSNELSRLLGCRHRWDDRMRALIVDTDSVGRTSVDGVWVLGDAAAVYGAKVAQSRGALAGVEIIRALRGSLPRSVTSSARRARATLHRNLRFQRAMQYAFDAPVLVDHLATADTTICRCENVRLSDVSTHLDELSATPGAAKRETRAGMGKCQGRYCGPVLMALSSAQLGEEITETSGFAPQAPTRPTTIAAIARSDSDVNHAS